MSPVAGAGDADGASGEAGEGHADGASRTAGDGDALTALQTLPSIGPRLAEKLVLVGVRSPADLRGRDAQDLYDELQRRLGPVDRCVLYAFRCAVFAAERDAGAVAGDPQLTRWWNWKDDGLALRRAQAAAGRRRSSMPSR